MPKFKTFLDISTHLDRLGLFHMDLGLERMRQFARAAEGLGCPVVHVVGTNGKGSTSAFLERLARAHGLVTGLYTSPHFMDVRERIRVNGELLPKPEWVEHANALDQLVGQVGLTYFEWLTCLAALLFAGRGVDLAVMEAGLGGRHDATRVFDPQLVLLTTVALDHESVLGSTLAAIADDKCRAIRPGCVAITAPQPPEVMEVYLARAVEVGVELLQAEPVARGPFGLAGAYQRVNAGLALAGWRELSALLGRAGEERTELDALAQTRLPGRFQVAVSPRTGQTLVLDGAHNVSGLQALGAALAEGDLQPQATIFACMADKDVSAMAATLLAATAGPVLLPRFDTHGRGMDPEKLEPLLAGRGRVCASMKRALDEAAGAEPLLVCGSLYLLAEFYRLHPRLLDT